ncbi:MAG: hypothetical protein BRC28_01440 [Nanohaloarchaea archaeon SW_4_43_9]|nr:MAG: hypothetical protein BRC28_01440 [Nanohaloarchaea archaeon SW_4_43_9]
MELKRHLLNSTAVSMVSLFACLGFIAFARRTAEINPGFEPLQYGPVAISLIVSSYTAYAVFYGFKKYLDRPYELFMYLSGFILIISYMPIGHIAVGMETARMAEINVLGTVHALAAVFIISGIAKLEIMNRI